jgi:hypothetical protein
MKAINVVRIRVKPGRDKEFIDLFEGADQAFAGMRRVYVVQTGEGSYCLVGEWNSFDDIVSARPSMGKILNTFRDCLEDFGGGMGVTDPVSGIVILEREGPAKAEVQHKVKRTITSAKKRPNKKSAKKPAKTKSNRRRKR